jgi:hypothetical protein
MYDMRCGCDLTGDAAEGRSVAASGRLIPLLNDRLKAYRADAELMPRKPKDTMLKASDTMLPPRVCLRLWGHFAGGHQVRERPVFGHVLERKRLPGAAGRRQMQINDADRRDGSGVKQTFGTEASGVGGNPCVWWEM